MQKQDQTPVGDITVTTPRDRDASFEPLFIKKRETMLSEGMADRIIGLYALGTSTRDISNWLEETVGTSVSAETVSSITDRVLPEQKGFSPPSFAAFRRARNSVGEKAAQPCLPSRL